MKMHAGDRVLVNIAPFIGWADPAHESIPCRVLSVVDASIEVATEHPQRPVVLQIAAKWVELTAFPASGPRSLRGVDGSNRRRRAGSCETPSENARRRRAGCTYGDRPAARA